MGREETAFERVLGATAEGSTIDRESHALLVLRELSRARWSSRRLSDVESRCIPVPEQEEDS
jgi:hypothetical protein